MVATTFKCEVTSPIAPERLFKVLSFDRSYVPTDYPKGIKSIDLVEGDGGVGSVFLVTYAEGNHIMKSAKHRIEKVDKENLVYSHTIVEVELASGEAAKDDIESVTDVLELTPSGDGGTLVKATSTYNTKGDVGVTEQQINGGKRVGFMIKNITEFLIAHPEAYV